MRSQNSPPRLALLALTMLGASALMLAAVACNGAPAAPAGEPAVSPPAATAEPSAASPTPTAASGETPTSVQPRSDFPTGPAVTVEAGYEPPDDRVPSTGAYVPANGRPTLVYVDAIW